MYDSECSGMEREEERTRPSIGNGKREGEGRCYRTERRLTVGEISEGKDGRKVYKCMTVNLGIGEERRRSEGNGRMEGEERCYRPKRD